MKDYANASLLQLAARIARREVSVEQVARAAITHIEEYEPAVHAWQYFDPQLVLEQARLLDAQSHQGLLHGVPLGVKDLMDTEDMPDHLWFAYLCRLSATDGLRLRCKQSRRRCAADG